MGERRRETGNMGRGKGDRRREKGDGRKETGERIQKTEESRGEKGNRRRETGEGRRGGEGYITYMTYRYSRTVLRSRRRCEGPTPAPP